MSANAITNPDLIQLFRLETLLKGAKLEKLGMRRKGPSCLSILKNMGFKGSRDKVIEAADLAVKCMRLTIVSR
jgi:hypothetical protein